MARRKAKSYPESFRREAVRLADHIGDGTGATNFKICGWRTNDSKNDLELSEFLLVCESVLKHLGILSTTLANLSVDRTARKLRLRVSSALRAPAAGCLKRRVTG